MKTGWQDPLSGEIISPDIAGLQEAVGKIEDALDLKVVNATDVPLTEIFISENNRYRIYQAEGKRNWVSNPAPVIKVNGTPVSSGFTINYGGGAVVFEPSLTVADVVTADFSYVTDVSNRLDTQENTLNTHLNNTADAFDEAKTYAVGDYCIYNNALYRCIVAVETAGEWNPDNWVATSVGAEIMAHKAEESQKHITESGENANGRWIRFSDGTQICWAEHEENITTTVYDGTNYSVLNAHLWPAPFSATYPLVGAITGNKSEIIGIAQYSWGNSAYAGAIYTRVPFSNKATKIRAFAIGRWK